MLGEALGIAAVAAAYAAIDRGILVAPTWILVAGAWEGLSLGIAQSLVLRKIGVRSSHWIVLTVAGAVAGYALSLIGGAGQQSSSASEPSAMLLILLGAGLGVVMGLLMGAVQWIAARGKIAATAWIGMNALGWAPAMAIILLAASAAERAWSMTVIILVGAAAGSAAGIAVGAVTAFALPGGQSALSGNSRQASP